MMDSSGSETMRYLAASVLQNRAFRRQVIEHVEEERRALAPEIGVDLQQLAQISYLLESRDKRYDLLFLIITAICGIVALTRPGSALILLVIAGSAAYFYKAYEQHKKLMPFVAKDSCDLDGLELKLRVTYPTTTIQRTIPSAEQNVLVYSGFSPFVGVGYSLGGWSFPVTINQPKQEIGQVCEIIPFKLNELYAAIDRAIDECAFNNCTTRDFLFANGKQIRDQQWLLPSIYGNPVDRASDRCVQEHIEGHDPVVRYYKWTYMHDWGNEIVVSYFLRFSFIGAQLFVEANRFLLTPVAAAHRTVDEASSSTTSRLSSLLLSSLVVGPFAAVVGALTTLGNLLTDLQKLDLFGAQERSKRQEIERSVYYDYGASTSLREKASGPAYRHYFQMLDKEMYVKIFEKQLLVALQDFLDAHNIDTSDIKERQTTILNSGVIVQGGELKAEALSVGAGAQSSIRINQYEGTTK
jgi:hypothetical protein